MKNLYAVGCIVIVAMCLSFQSRAQCSLVEPAIELNNVFESGGNCMVNINLSFTLDKNNGNKFTYVHLWKPADYPNISYSSKGPKATDLGANVLATLAIDTDGAVSMLSTYSADPDNVIPLTGLTVSEEDLGNDLFRITINNIQFAVPGACADLPILKGDVWSTQAASANPNVHCSSKNFSLQINDPVISGKINCNEPDGPRTFDLDIITTNPLAFGVTYKLYLDDGVLTNGLTTFSEVDDQLFFTSSLTNLSSSLPIKSKDEAYPYAFLEDKRTIWVVLTGASLPNAIVAELSNGCQITLPVVLTRFNGTLLDNAVSLSWTTTEESGSSYFAVERSADSKEFGALGKINAKNNSSVTQQYNFVDRNPLNGVNYYRLRMVDLDGKYEHSRIIAIDNGAGSLAFELLGNPAANREIKFLLKNEDASQIHLYDLSGKSIKFSLTHSGTDYTLKPKGNLTPGLYVLSLQRSNAGVVAKKVLVP